MTDTPVQIGLDIIEKKWPKKLKGSRIGLLVHPASVNKSLEHAVSLLIKSKKFELKVLFGPQHGIRGETQDNMVEWNGFYDPGIGLQIFSLYGNTRKPEPQMLKDIDVMVIDLQDIGSRYYTFIWTTDLCIQACLEMGKSVVILDRPNPIGGHILEGPVLDNRYASFVGLHPLPVRHGMTIGEIGNYLRNEFFQSLDFHVIKLLGWKRRLWFDETDLFWVMPSPNMSSLDTAMVYPGMCLLEGTNISEGRGTTRPFEICGAPFIEAQKLERHLKNFNLRSVIFRPLHFLPTFQKYTGELCGGIQIHVTNREKFKPFKTGVAIIKAIYDLYSKSFEWKQPPYEYEYEKLPIDILAGTDRIRKSIENGDSLSKMEECWQDECRTFQEEIRRHYLLYK